MEIINGVKRATLESARIGGSANHLDVDSDGILTLEGDAQRNITLRPMIQLDEIRKVLKPDLVTFGVHTYYSLPVYSDDNEEIFMAMNVPQRWNGTTAPRVHVHTCLTGTETVGHKYKLQIAYSVATPSGSLASPASSFASAETVIVEGRTSEHDCYLTELTLSAGFGFDDTLSLRLRRLAATEATDIGNELGVSDTHVDFRRDKLGGDW